MLEYTITDNAYKMIQTFTFAEMVSTEPTSLGIGVTKVPGVAPVPSTTFPAGAEPLAGAAATTSAVAAVFAASSAVVAVFAASSAVAAVFAASSATA